jgi:hypothetical protein
MVTGLKRVDCMEFHCLGSNPSSVTCHPCGLCHFPLVPKPQFPQMQNEGKKLESNGPQKNKLKQCLGAF